MKRYLDHADIVRRYQAGERIHAIARAHRCQHSAVQYILRRAGVYGNVGEGRARGDQLARDRYLIRAGVMP